MQGRALVALQYAGQNAGKVSSTDLEVVQAVLVHDVYSAQLGDCEVQQGTANCNGPVTLPTLLDLLLGDLAVGQALADRPTHCLTFAEGGDEGLCQFERNPRA